MPIPSAARLTPLLIALTSLSELRMHAAPEAIEITSATKQLLPRGKEADGIIGDFLLRNDRIEAVISANLPLRRANMSTFYGPDGITPGCLYDLSLNGQNNDQITVFCPSSQQGAVSWVRILPGKPDEALIETRVTAGAGGGLSKTHLYRLKDGWQGVEITTTLTNESQQPVKTTFQDRWTNFIKTGVAPDGILWANAVDPADGCGYAAGALSDPTNALRRPAGELMAGESVSYSRFLAVGKSPADAVSQVLAQRGETAHLSGTVRDADGTPIAGAALFLRPLFQVAPVNPPPASGKPTGPSNHPDSNGRLAGIAYTDKDGRFNVTVKAGKYRVTANTQGRGDVERDVEAKDTAITNADFQLGPEGRIQFEITDEKGVSIPCKAQFLALEGTEPVNLGPDQRAHGCRDQYHNENGRFEVPLPAGRYRVIVTRGIEYSHLAQEVEVVAGKPLSIKGVLKRLVDTKGWVSTDYHNHSTPSGDNVCGTADRLINLAAEHIEFAPTTEHNRLFDWRPEIERLGLTPFLQTVPGMELTGTKAHFNSFPFEPVPFTQDNGAPVWNADPRITAHTLREWQKIEPSRWVQINHPDVFSNFFEDRGTGDHEGGFAGLVQMVDGYETENFSPSNILSGKPFSITRSASGAESVTWSRPHLWLQMLNQGRRTNAVAVCDAHSVYGNGVGGWRMYMPSSSDEPASIDWKENVRHAKAGKSYLTNGPFLQVSTPQGNGPGDTFRAKDGTVLLNVHVQCTDWIDIDRVQLLINGQPSPQHNFTRKSHPEDFRDDVTKFIKTLKVELKADAHLIVVVTGENHTLKTGYGTSTQASMKPLAYHNPLFVTTSDAPFRPCKDDVGIPVGTRKPSVTEAKALLEKAALR
ncbi:MAG: hypothetical protein RIS92_2012 [Verrucomicrobiota bacterium]